MPTSLQRPDNSAPRLNYTVEAHESDHLGNSSKWSVAYKNGLS